MPKASRYDYPSRDLQSCVDVLKKAHENLKSYVMTRESFADAIGMSPKGGGFNLLVGSLSIYKLIETGEGEIRFTDLTKNILHGTPSEISEAMTEATRNVLIIADLYDTYKGIPNEEQLRLFLKTKANVDIGQISKVSADISKLFKRLVIYLKSIEQPTGGEKIGMDLSEPEQIKWELLSPYGRTVIKDAASFDAAQALLTVAKKTFSENSSNHNKGKKDSTQPT